MKPINSKEKSKQLWQFVLIFFGLAVIPVALIFFSYYHVPDEISESEEKKLVTYSNFEHNQKLILKKLADVDSDINRYAETKTENTVLLDRKIADELNDLSKADTSIPMVQLVTGGYAKHFTHVRNLVAAQDRANKAEAELQKSNEQMKSMGGGGMGMGGGMNMATPPMQAPPAQ